MLTRTPLASRSLSSQPWSTSSVASFTTSARFHDFKPPQPFRGVGWDGPSTIINPRGAKKVKDRKNVEKASVPRREAPTPAWGQLTQRQNGSATPRLAPATAKPTDTGKQPPSRSEIMEEMKAFIWEKLATPPSQSEEDAPVMTYKVSRDPTVPASPPSHGSKKRSLRLPPMDYEVIQWLKQAADNVQPNDFYNGPTLLVLNGASKSLLESDFYRLARQGKHLDNWAIGLVRVVQARDPATHEPIGKYYIFFETRTAALAYEEGVIRLHELARRRYFSPRSETPFVGLIPKLETEDDVQLRGFTLLPPTAKLDLTVYLAKDLDWEPPPLQVEMKRSQDLLFRPEGRELHAVLISLDGAMTTVAALHNAIERDGRDRRMPWRDGESSSREMIIRAVEPGGKAVVDGTSEGDTAALQGPPRILRYSRFVVPFADENGVRRFVRHWHRREMKDFEGRDITVTVNATAMW
ncbi:hypothetical protein DL546_007959 [Coniochaeta pulveracea]|uniref:Uncharacterized protein n=1 Tax=Coniochaeta pulveracea TaxID=177199 RepID=A0A420YDC4_9PEZI|nr:hypothetical protein DL546_007959 [Coniochaeta pulveracea]